MEEGGGVSYVHGNISNTKWACWPNSGGDTWRKAAPQGPWLVAGPRITIQPDESAVTLNRRDVQVATINTQVGDYLSDFGASFTQQLDLILSLKRRRRRRGCRQDHVNVLSCRDHANNEKCNQAKISRIARTDLSHETTQSETWLLIILWNTQVEERGPFLQDLTNEILETLLQSSHSQGHCAVVCHQQDYEAPSNMDWRANQVQYDY